MKYFLNFVIFISMLSMLCSCGDKSENDEAFQYSNTTKEIFAELEKDKKFCSDFKILKTENEWDLFHDGILSLLTEFQDEITSNSANLYADIGYVRYVLSIDEVATFKVPHRILKKDNRSTLIRQIKGLKDKTVQGIDLKIIFEKQKSWKNLKIIVLKYEKKLSELANSLPALKHFEQTQKAGHAFNELNKIGDKIIEKTKKIFDSIKFSSSIEPSHRIISHIRCLN